MAPSSFLLTRLLSRSVTMTNILSGRSLLRAQSRARVGGVEVLVVSSPPSRSSALAYSFSTTVPRSKKEWCEVTYERADGTTFTVKGKEGDNLLDIAVNNDLDLEGFGACEGTLACSTCHLIFKKEDFDLIEDPCTDEELDMLDLAYGLSDTSRLGCQVCLTKKLNGMKVKVPEGTADAREM